MHVVTFACQKGAAGKTTLVGHVGVQAEFAGAGPVVLLDTDQQGALAEWWNARQPERPAFAHTFIEQIGEDIARLRDLGFALCLIDSPSTISPAVEQVVAVADLVVIPCRPSPHDLRAATRTIDLVDRLGKPKVFILNGTTPGDGLTDDAARVLAEAGTVAPVHIDNDPEFAESMFDGWTAMEASPEGGPARQIGDLWTYLSTLLAESPASEGAGPFSAAG